jgi:hypothetical protein
MPLRMRALAAHLQVVVAVLVAMLAMGRGLPGIVAAVVDAPSHVCTCAAGGDHASCPVCNQTLSEKAPPRHVEARGAPCGKGQVGDLATGEMGTLPACVTLSLAPLARVAVVRARSAFVERVPLEPATPPPRLGAA